MSQIGVLALQGAFSMHRKMLEQISVKSVEVRYAHQLESCSGLILPGGESTTIWSLMEKNSFLEPLRRFSKPLFGTCAGLILLSRLKLLEVDVERNGFGRQSASFSATLQSTLGEIASVFIRAPRIKSISSNVEVLACLNDEPVLVQQGKRLGATFHPELTDELTVHRYFVRMCDNDYLPLKKMTITI